MRNRRDERMKQDYTYQLIFLLGNTTIKESKIFKKINKKIMQMCSELKRYEYRHTEQNS